MRVIVFCFLLLIAASPALAGAWLQPVGQGYASLQGTYFTSSHYYDQNSARQPQSTFTKYELQPYMEYGLTRRLTIGGTAYAQMNQQDEHTKLGIADPELFARTEIWTRGVQHVSLQPLIKFKSQYRSPDATPRGGSMSTDAELSVLYGSNLTVFTARDYLDLRAGYRLRGGALNDQWRGDVALGMNVTPQWQIIPALRMVMSTRHSTSTTFSETGDQDYDLLKAELGAAYAVGEGQHIRAALFTHLMGTQTGDGVGISVGYSENF